MKKTIIVPAYAKINPVLWVKNKRPDGYHDLQMLMQSVSLADNIVLSASREEGIGVTCSDESIPSGPDNLVYKAALEVFELLKITPAVKIHIEKHIPAAAGLGGGSADAAAVIAGIPRLYEKTVSLADLMEVGAKVGSDVPFMIRGGLGLAFGRGEQVQFLEKLSKPLIVVLVMPIDCPVSTKWVYQNYQPSQNSSKASTFSLAVTAYIKRDLLALRQFAFNDLESVTLHRYPVIQRIKEMLEKNGKGVAMMSGSGSTVFGLFYTRKDALDAISYLEGMPVMVELTDTSVYQNKFV